MHNIRMNSWDCAIIMQWLGVHTPGALVVTLTCYGTLSIVVVLLFYYYVTLEWEYNFSNGVLFLELREKLSTVGLDRRVDCIPLELRHSTVWSSLLITTRNIHFIAGWNSAIPSAASYWTSSELRFVNIVLHVVDSFYLTVNFLIHADSVRRRG